MQTGIKNKLESFPRIRRASISARLRWNCYGVRNTSPVFVTGAQLSVLLTSSVGSGPCIGDKSHCRMNLREIALEKTARSACVSGHACLRTLSVRFVVDRRSCLGAGERDAHGTGERSVIEASGWPAHVSPGVNRARSKRVD